MQCHILAHFDAQGVAGSTEFLVRCLRATVLSQVVRPVPLSVQKDRDATHES